MAKTASYPYVKDSVPITDDLYRHVNGKWLDTHEMPEDRATDGAFYEIYLEAEKRTKGIIEKCAKGQHKKGSIEQKIGDLYTSFMDEEHIEKLGATPIRKYIKRIGELKTIDDILAYLPEHSKIGMTGFYAFYVSGDPGNPEKNILHIFQAGIGLPDESYYREDDFAEIRKEYVTYAKDMYELAGNKDAENQADTLYKFEETIAKHHWDNVSNRDAHKTYNLFEFDKLKKEYPKLAAWLLGLGLTKKQVAQVNIYQPSYIEAMEELLAEDNVAAIKDLLELEIIRSYAPYLSDDFVKRNFEFYSHKLSGTPQMRVRWKRGVSFTEGVLGEAIGQVYVAEYFPETSKKKMEKLVEYLIKAYEQSINDLDWMSEETKVKAQDKLSKFIPKIGYPDKWRDYSNLEIDAKDLIGNVQRSNTFDLNYEFNKLGKPIDPDEWLMYPQTVNAYYHPTRNEIVFPAAILSYPFFDPERDAASNFGAIGAVIGHEIGHGFDDQGSNYDGNGKLVNWWNDKDRESFTKLTKKLVEQYNALSPEECPKNHVNGELTLGENIGDLGGLGIAYQAYKLMLDGKDDEVIDGLTGDQRFFYSWANSWRSMIRPEEALNRLTTDPHSPNEFRCNQIVKNIDAFYEAFNVKENDEMWLEAKDRVIIW
ncbi:MAG: M13-type metalloendopeptidase [Micrococcaceae bacterium]